LNQSVAEECSRMDLKDLDVVALREDLASARLEEAEAVRHAHCLRAIGDTAEIREAIHEVNARQTRVALLQLELRKKVST
jgi:hypothetical protein